MRLRFGDRLLDLDRSELYHGDSVVHVEPQVFDVLAHLVISRERLVTKEELLDEIWGSRFVSESALTSRVKSARRAIGDSGASQQLIRTIRGKGFRFVAPVIEEPAAASEQSSGHDSNGSAHHDSDRPTSAIPNPPTTFVGRTDELQTLADAIGTHRMVTITGTGGIGKTRLAIRVAADVAPAHRDGVWFVDLAAVTDSSRVPDTIAETIGVLGQHDTSIEPSLVAAINDQHMLIVIDNCEHLLEATRACVDRLMTTCPNVHILATSRTRLLAPYEHVYLVPGLTIRDDGGDAVELFLTRLRAAGIPAGQIPDRDRVARLCRAVDGIALAIELAAARYPTLGIDGLESGLGHGLEVLSGGARTVHHHRTLRDTIAWSDALLTPGDRALFHAVAMFANAFDADAATALIPTDSDRPTVVDGLGRLAERSLLVVEHGSVTRYRALETIRQFGVEQLQSTGAVDEVRDRHTRWCRHLVNRLLRAVPDDGWCSEFDRIVDDLRLALAHPPPDGPAGGSGSTIEFVEDVATLLLRRGRLIESQRRFEEAAAMSTDRLERARLLRCAAGVATTRYAGNDALDLLRCAADIAVEAGQPEVAARDLAAMATMVVRVPGIMAKPPAPGDAAALVATASELAQSDPAARAGLAVAQACAADGLTVSARALTNTAIDLARACRDPVLESAALDNLCAIALTESDLATATTANDRRVEIAERLGIDALTSFEISDIYVMASDVSLAAGELDEAVRHADALAALPFFREQEHLALARHLKVEALAGRLEEVVHRADRFRDAWQDAGSPRAPNLASSAHAAAMAHGLLGDDDQRGQWLAIVESLAGRPGTLSFDRQAWAPTFDALYELHHDRPDDAVDLLDVSPDDATSWATWSGGLWRTWYSALWVEAGVLAGTGDVTDRLDVGQRAVRGNRIAECIVERAGAIAVGETRRLIELTSDFERLGCVYQVARSRHLADRGIGAR